MTTNAITPEQIVDVLEDRLFVDVTSPDHDLIESGDLDSLRFVELLMAAEELAGRRIPAHNLDLDSMRTPRTIAKALSESFE